MHSLACSLPAEHLDHSVTSDDEPSPRLGRWLVGIAIVVAGAVGALLWTTDDRTTSQVDVSPPPAPAGWPVEPTREVRLAVDADGPSLVRNAENLSLVPKADALSNLEWRVRSGDGTTRLSATGRWHGETVRLDWQFASGNPQARLTVRLRDVPVRKLAQTRFSFHFSLPEGPVDVLADEFEVESVEDDTSESLRIPPVRPTWLRWRPGTRSMTWHRWSGDGVSVQPSEDSSIALAFDLWRPRLHPSLQPCRASQTGDKAPGRDERTVDLRATLTMSLGDAPRIFPAAFPSSHRGLLVPVFDLPSTHPDSQIEDATPRNAEDWAHRATTLAYGHSDPDDPRYGTGGLLGNGLGGTIVAPASYVGTDAFERLENELDGSAVGLAVRGRSGKKQAGEGEAPAIRIGNSVDCEAAADAFGESTPVALAGPLRPPKSPPTDALRGSERDGMPNFPIPTQPLPVRPLVDQLDGSRQTLLDEVLGQSTLESLVEARGLALVATPFVASRNPLVPAAREALLDPERFGRWTIAPPFSNTLTELALTRESTPVGVVGLERTVRHLRTAQSTLLDWRADGTLRVDPTHARGGADELTLVALGERFRRTSVEIDGEPPRHRMDSGNDRPDIRFSFELDDGDAHAVSFEGADGPPSGLEPVTWTVDR